MPAYFDPTGSGGSFEEFIARYLNGKRPQGRPIDVTRLLSRRTNDVLADAAKYAAGLGHAEVDALHILHEMIGRQPAEPAIRHAGVDTAALAHAVESRLPAAGEAAEAPQVSLTASAQRALLDAHQVARAFGSTYIDPEHLMFALVVNREQAPGQVLAAHGLTPEALQQGAQEAVAAGELRLGTDTPADAAADAAEPSTTPTLDQYGTDLTALAREGRLDPVIGRADEIEQAVEILSRRTKNNPVLIGEAGVGKTAVVEGLAQAVVAGEVPEQLEGKRVVSLDLASMVAGTRFRGDFEERLTKTVDEIAGAQGELIVFLDELHTVVGAGGSGEAGGMDAGNILKPRLARGELHVIGATTLAEYRKIEKDAALARRFQPVQIGEPSIEDAVRIIAGLAPRYAEHHGVRYSDDAVRAAVELSARYLTDRQLPDKAIDLIDQAGARLRLRLGKRVDVESLRLEHADALREKEAAVAEERYEDASAIRDRIDELQRRMDAAAAAGLAAEAVVDEPEIAEVISRATGIPAARITEGERGRLAALEEELHGRVVGQRDAVSAISKAVRRNRTGLGDPNRPVGSFLFLGPTGVGKTELAKALAERLFGDERAMLRFDMSEFGERHTVSRLVGAPPGYVGYDEAGQLTERVRRNPYSVVLLDEIEKAHPDVFNLLLQVLDDGRLTDGQGRTVDFRNTVVIMTSNIGSEFLASRSGALGFVADTDGSGNGFGSEQALRDRVMGKLREAMRPEFLNRIDEVVLFQKLSRDELHEIVGLLLERTRGRIAAQGFALEVGADAVSWLAEHGYEPEFGARPLRRLIQREVEDRVAQLMVDGSLEPGSTIVLGADDDGIVARAERATVAA